MVDMSKLRVGTPVRLRNGEVHVVEKWSQDPDSVWPFEVSFFGCMGGSYDYTEQGFFWDDPDWPDPLDIVEILSTKEVEDDGFVTFHPDLDKKPDFELKRTKPVGKVNLDNLKVGDTIKLADGTVAVVSEIERIPEGDREFRLFGHCYTVIFLTEDGSEDSWDYCKDGTGNALDDEQIVAIIPKEASGRPKTPGDDEVTLRDRFALAALAGEMPYDLDHCLAGTKVIAEYCWEVADAMLEARDK